MAGYEGSLRNLRRLDADRANPLHSWPGVLGRS